MTDGVVTVLAFAPRRGAPGERHQLSATMANSSDRD